MQTLNVHIYLYARRDTQVKMQEYWAVNYNYILQNIVAALIPTFYLYVF